MPIDFRPEYELHYKHRDENGDVMIARKSLRCTDVDIQCDKEEAPALKLENNAFSFTFKLTRLKDRKKWADIFMLPDFKATEFCFPKKKPRGTMRRKRREKRRLA